MKRQIILVVLIPCLLFGFYVPHRRGAFQGAAPVTLKINSGQSKGDVGGFINDDPYASAGSQFQTTASITDDGEGLEQGTWQTERYGNFTYTLNELNANTSYTIKLHFVEFIHNSVGARVFDVSIQGTLELDDYDIYADVGHDIGVTKTYTATSDGSGEIAIQFTTVTDNAKCTAVQAIEL